MPYKKQEKYLSKYAIFPNQNETFSLKKDLKFDEGIEECYKTLMKQYGFDIK